jgi:3-oxoacyl-[acyl-carrier protein] reductase
MNYIERALILQNHIAPSPVHGLSLNPTSGNGGGQLAGQVAIITGSGQGIGAATARLFAKEGAKVVVSDLDDAKAKAVAEEIKKAGGQAIAVSGDVTDAAFPEKIIGETIKAFGKLNILVNNAGYTWDGVIQKMTEQQWEAMFKVHCTAPFRLIKTATPYLRDAAKKEREEGAQNPENRVVINISSTSGTHGNAGQINYSTAKAGVVGMTKTIAKEWGPFGVRCNCIAFGYIETRLTAAKEKSEAIEMEGKKIAIGIPSASRDVTLKMVPLQRAGKPEEAAASVLFLASPQASYITGQCLEVTGGAGI